MFCTKFTRFFELLDDVWTVGENPRDKEFIYAGIAAEKRYYNSAWEVKIFFQRKNLTEKTVG